MTDTHILRILPDTQNDTRSSQPCQGVVNVSAKDTATGKEQKITITASYKSAQAPRAHEPDGGAQSGGPSGVKEGEVVEEYAETNQ